MFQTLDNTKKPITLLLKGPPGAGKTFKAAQFPRPVIFTFDNNLSCLKKLDEATRKGIKIANPRLDDAGKPLAATAVWDRFVKMLEQACANASIATIIIDSMTTLSEVLMDKILGTGDPSKKIELQHWGDSDRYLKWFAETLLCAKDLDKNVIVISHEMSELDKDGGLRKYILNFGGKKVRSSYDLYFTDCWRAFTKVTGIEIQYCIRTIPDTYFDAKCSLTLPPVFEWQKERDNIFKQLEFK